jgi:hypothetical protein
MVQRQAAGHPAKQDSDALTNSERAAALAAAATSVEPLEACGVAIAMGGGPP